jgi:two-component sensor histidine kinase
MTGVFGAELSGYSTGSAVSDIDNDGDPDLYVANYTNGNSQLFLNINEKGSSIKMNLHGVYSNRDAIGAKVWLYSLNPPNPKLIGYREISAGSGYGSSNDKELIFGVAKGEKMVAKIKFPSSADTLSITDLQVGQCIDVYEASGVEAVFSKASSWTVRFLSDPELQTEILKYIFIITMLMFYNIRIVPKIKRIITISIASSFLIFIIFIGVNSFFLFQGFSFNFFIAPITALILLFILHLLSGRILLRRLANEQQLLLREKLARDLHDDLASTLGSISIYAQTLNQITPLQDTGPNLPNKIARLTQTAIQSISDIIWMTSPRNDTLHSLISKTSNYLLEVLQDNNIGYSQQIELPDQPITIRESLRNDAFLILKEALHNIIKHSGAKKVTFKASLNATTCTLVLKDDGKGIASTASSHKSGSGNGLLNMQRRAKESQIEFAIISQAGKGTEILLIFKI